MIARKLEVQPAYFIEEKVDDPFAGPETTLDADMRALAQFARSRESLSLNSAFHRIRDPEVRKYFIALITAVANRESGTDA